MEEITFTFEWADEHSDREGRTVVSVNDDGSPMVDLADAAWERAHALVAAKIGHEDFDLVSMD